MIKEYRFNKGDTQKYLYKVLLKLIVWLVIPIGGIILYKEIKDFSSMINIIKWVLVVWGVLYVLPLFILYFNHHANSKSVEFSFEQEGNKFKYSSNKKNVTFTMDDIEKIELYLRPNMYEKFFELQYFGDYHYYRIFIKKRGAINISCLVCDEIEDFIPEKLIKRKKKYLPILE